MKIKLNGNDKMELLNGMDDVLRMKDIPHILAAVVDGKCLVTSNMEEREQFEEVLLYVLWGACRTRGGVVRELAKLTQLALNMKAPEADK